MSEYRKNRIAGEEENTIDLRPLLRALLRGAWIIILAAVLLGAAAFWGTKMLIAPTYRSSFTAYVNNRTNAESTTSVTSADLSASRSLVQTYAAILTSRTVLEEAAVEAGTNYSYSQMNQMVSTSVVSDTEIITVYVVSTDPVEARDLAQAIADVAPLRVSTIVEGSSMQVVDAPVLPTSRYAPNYQRNTMMGALLGAFLAAALIVLRELMDDHVKDEEALEERFGLPVLGSIPNIAEASRKNNDYGYSKKGES